MAGTVVLIHYQSARNNLIMSKTQQVLELAHEMGIVRAKLLYRLSCNISLRIHALMPVLRLIAGHKLFHQKLVSLFQSILIALLGQ